MEIKKKYIEKYLYSIALDQITDEYQKKGYKIFKGEKIANFNVDLIAKNDFETIVFEIKTNKLTKEKKKSIIKIGNYIRKQKDYRFLIIIATAPKNKKLEIENIESELFNCFIEDIPDEVDMLSTHTFIEEITDVDIDEIIIDNQYLFIKGDGVVSIQLQYGSDGDQKRDNGYKMYDNFPFDFDVTMEYIKNQGFKIIEVNDISVDISSF
ncbi:hypothetical protein [uncultured Flavobacterium sp.]|uniref:pPIWI-associating nuclease domain-containing protein n=1 Tax=uncultured Flavobacterium sp. TaxID=165435 RepID=UPI0027E1B062|nr:hypothetical protein [uncultured Flavobacterium sp.]